jgi:anaerobic magnesium-protoporphyrin IX monomethyl ester cyclase
MKVLVTHSYFLKFDSKQEKIMQPFPPLGTIYAAKVLRDCGAEIIFYDCMFEESEENIFKIIDKTNPDLFLICDDGFNYLTKMCLTNMREASLRMVNYAAKKNIFSMVASSDSTDHFQRYLNSGASVVFIGEVEKSLQEFYVKYKTKSDWNSIDGIAFREDNTIKKSKKREVIKDIDELGLPAWDLIDIEKYKSKWIAKNGYFSLNCATTRGCPYKCNWCAKPIYGNRYNSRSPQLVVKELKILIQNFGATHIWFCDDIFGLKPNWVKEFADLVIAEELKFEYKIQSRVDLLLQPDYLDDLKRSGCKTVWVGAESGSQKILDEMDKGTKVEQIKLACSLMKEKNIEPAFFIQFGYLGEEWTDIEKTIEMLEDCMPTDIGISVSYPLPGTKFYDKVKDQLTQKQNWSHSDDLLLMFKNTYPPEFYRLLHSYVHKRFRKRENIIKVKSFFKEKKSEIKFRNFLLPAYYSILEFYYKRKLDAFR